MSDPRARRGVGPPAGSPGWVALHSRRDALKDRVDRLLRHPRVELGLVALIALSVLAVLLEVAFAPGSPTRTALHTLGNALGLVFAVELALRCWVAPSKRRFFRRYLLDILAVLPIFRPLRLLRALMLLRLFRAGLLLNRRLSTWGGLIGSSAQELTSLLSLAVTVILVAATTVHLIHGTVQTDTEGLEGALWFAVYTMLGGEPLGGLPQSQLGRAVSLALMVGGMTIFGVFVGTVSAAMVRILADRAEVNEMDLADLRGQVLVCGWNRAGPALVREFFSPQGSSRCDALVLITEQGGLPPGFPTQGLPMERIYPVQGDYTQVAVLEQAGVHHASVAILLDDTTTPRPPADRDARTVLAALTIERLTRQVFCVAQLNSEQHEPLLRMYGVEEIVIGDWYTGAILGSIGRNHGLVAVLTDILSTQTGNAFHKLIIPPALQGQTIGALHQRLKQDHNAILVSLERHAPAREIHVNPACEFVVQAGDVVVIIARGDVAF